MFGPDYELGACPGCSNLGDELDATRVHLNHRDVTLICFSRAPIDRLTAYKERMGWQFPYVSTYGTDFPFDFGLAMTPEQAQEIPEVKEMVDDPPEWLEDWGQQVGAELEDGLREDPSFIAFARENGTIYHTYTVLAPDPFVAPYYSFLLERTPKPCPRSPERGARTSTRTDWQVAFAGAYFSKSPRPGLPWNLSIHRVPPFSAAAPTPMTRTVRPLEPDGSAPVLAPFAEAPAADRDLLDSRVPEGPAERRRRRRAVLDRPVAHAHAIHPLAGRLGHVKVAGGGVGRGEEAGPGVGGVYSIL